MDKQYELAAHDAVRGIWTYRITCPALNTLLLHATVPQKQKISRRITDYFGMECIGWPRKGNKSDVFYFRILCNQ